MACGSCSSGGCSPAGCGDKGHCASGGCNRLNVYDWLSDIDIPTGFPVFDVVEVRFKAGRKDYYRNVNGLDLFPGDLVAVEAQSGHDIGEVSLRGELVRLQLKKKKVKDVDGLKKIYRIATENDIIKYTDAKQREPEVVYKTREIIQRLGISMKLSDVESQGDNSKITFFYTADDRVDFRELIKVLAETFRVRIEMRQIGARQEAALIGGIGACGRELCCTTWLTDFKSVNTAAARYQNLSLNPLKLAGQCGRLKCCLNYELDTYMDALKHFPDDARTLHAEIGTAELQKNDIFKQLMWYSLQGQDANNAFALPVDVVVEIKALNKQGKKPATFEEFALVPEIDLVEEVSIQDELNEGSLTRFDQNKNKRKKKKKGGDIHISPEQTTNPNANQNLPAQNAAKQLSASQTQKPVTRNQHQPNYIKQGNKEQTNPKQPNQNQAQKPIPRNQQHSNASQEQKKQNQEPVKQVFRPETKKPGSEPNLDSSIALQNNANKSNDFKHKKRKPQKPNPPSNDKTS